MNRSKVYNKELHNLKINNKGLVRYGLSLKKDYYFTYAIVEEIERIWVKGRDMPYNKKIRNLPIEFTIDFDFKVDFDFNTRYKKLEMFLENSKEEILTFNNETTGFKIYTVRIENIVRGIGQDKVTIYFMCYPEIYNVDGTIFE